MKIRSKTSFEVIPAKGGTYRPQAPLWMFKNTGNTDMFINGIRHSPGEIFGIDNTQMVSLAFVFGKEVEIMEDTNYRIRFGLTVTDNGGLLNLAIRREAVLITTEYIKQQ